MFISKALIKSILVVILIVAFSNLCLAGHIYLYRESDEPELILATQESQTNSNTAPLNESQTQSSYEPPTSIKALELEPELLTREEEKASLPISPKKIKNQQDGQDSNQEKDQRENAGITSIEEEPIWRDVIPKTEPNTSYLEESKPFESMLTVFSTLILIIMLMLGISWFLQKKGFLNKSNYGKVLGIMPLDNKRLIYITDIMGKVYILGVTEYNINVIDEIKNPEALKLLKLGANKDVTFEESYAKAESANGIEGDETLPRGIKKALNFQSLKNLDK